MILTVLSNLTIAIAVGTGAGLEVDLVVHFGDDFIERHGGGV